jgi:hypothetical protein
LEENLETPEQYAALSYCWGGPSTNTLRKETYPTLLSDKPIQTLPRTIQDAIHVTQKLGIRFLWVDSLCIIQDDEDDKATQILQMADIYKGAQVTIAASSASGCTKGFLSGLEQSPVKDRLYQIESRVQDPLDSRAWAFQERLLSRRLLDFRSTGQYWFCDEHEAAMSNGATGAATGRTDRFDNIRKLFQGRMGPVQDKLKLVRYWHSIVEKFTQCHLTVPEDKLPAITGIAKEFNIHLGGQEPYCAGLWKFALPYDLLWIPEGTPIPRPRPLEARAPTWSWASIDGGISFRISARYYDNLLV